MNHHLPSLAESRRVVVFVVAILVASLVAALVYTIFAIRASQLHNGEVLRIVKDCTQPTGQCFKRGQRRTAHAVVGINQGTMRVIVAALTCQEQGFRGSALATCTAHNASR